MTILYWIIALLLPFAFLFVFTHSISKQFYRMQLIIGTLEDYPFPSDASDSLAHEQSLSRKAYIYIVLFAVNAVLLWLLPSIGRITFLLSDAFLLFLCYGQYLSLASTKRAYRSVDETIRAWYTPIIRVYRILLAYPAILFVVFNLFFDLVFGHSKSLSLG